MFGNRKLAAAAAASVAGLTASFAQSTLPVQTSPGAGQIGTPVAQPAAPSTPVREYLLYNSAPSGHERKDASLATQNNKLAKDFLKSETSADKEKIKKEIISNLDKLFESHLEQQQKEVDALEKQLEELKSTLKRRRGAKNSIVERRFEQLIQEADGLGWIGPSSRGYDWGAVGGMTTAAPGWSRIMAPTAETTPVVVPSAPATTSPKR